jgi:hypothetical protein
MGRTSVVGTQDFENVTTLVKSGAKVSDAIKQVAADRGASAGTVQAAYYRIKRQSAGGTKRKRRASQRRPGRGRTDSPKKKGRSLKAPAHSSCLLVLARYSPYGPVIVMYGEVKFAKVSVYVKLDSLMVESSVSLVQLPFGQVAFASKVASVGTEPDWSSGTASLPFFEGRLPVDDGAVWVWDLTSTIWPPWLRHWTVAEYVASNVAVAFVLPTPASSYWVHVTTPAVTVQPIVPVWRCVPVGAIVGSTVFVIVARATEADKAINSIARVVIIPARLIRFLILSEFFCSPEWVNEFS